MQSGSAGAAGTFSTTDHYSRRCPRPSLDLIHRGRGELATHNPSDSSPLGQVKRRSPAKEAGNTKIPMKTDNVSSPTVSPRIYVRCLAAYNSGTYHGAWIDADQDADGIMSDIQDMLANSPIRDAEEWAIHDFEGFGDVRLSESEDLENVSRMAEFITKHGRLGEALLSHFSNNIDEAEQALEENYHGSYASLGDYAEEMMEHLDVPEPIAPYVDYQRMGDDWETNGDIFTIELGYNQVHVFGNR